MKGEGKSDGTTDLVITISSSSPVQIKLVKKLPPSTTQPFAFPKLRDERPQLRSDPRRPHLETLLDVPGSGTAEIDSSQALPKTLVQVPDLNQLISFVERMRHVGDTLSIGVSKYGDLQLEISTTMIMLGKEFQMLLVLGERAEARASDPGVSPGTRTEMALRRGDWMMVQVSVKNFAKSLSSNLVKPDWAFYGIEEQSGYLVVVFQFFVPGTRITDKAISLHCRIPVIDPGCN